MPGEPLTYFAMGTALGVAAGISPGPLLVLIVTETIKFGKGAGIRIALVPLVSDLPIILVSFLLLDQVSMYRGALSWLSLVGAAYLVLLAIESLRTPIPAPVGERVGGRTMLKGVLANYLSPHPYLFWLVVGGPILVKGLETSAINGISFLLSFYLSIVGIKAVLALFVARGALALSGRWYSVILKSAGLLLAVMAVWLIYDAILFLSGATFG